MTSGDSGNVSSRSGRKYGAASITGAIVSTILALAVFSVTAYIRLTPSATPSATPTPSEQSPVCATGSLTLIGSSAFLPIAQGASNVYMSDCPGATITVAGGESAYGLTEVRDAVASGLPSARSMIAMYDGLPPAADTAGLRQYPMGVLILSVVAHTGLFPASNITADKLREIFVQPGEQGFVAVGRRAGSGTREAFFANILGVNPGPPSKGNCPPPTGSAISFTSCTEDSNADLLNFVNGTPNAIGYAEVLQPPTGYQQVSVINIDNVAPTPGNVLNGSYRFWMVENLYASMRPTTLTKDFLDFLPHYLSSNPSRNFIACSDAVKGLEDC